MSTVGSFGANSDFVAWGEEAGIISSCFFLRPPSLSPPSRLVDVSRLLTLLSPATKNIGQLRCRNYGCNQYFNEEDNRFVDELYQYLSGRGRFSRAVFGFGLFPSVSLVWQSLPSGIALSVPSPNWNMLTRMSRGWLYGYEFVSRVTVM